MDYDGYDALLHYIFKQVCISISSHVESLCSLFRSQTSSDAWFKPTEENIHSGVCLRVDQGRFRVFPYENPYLQPFERAIRILNPVAAVKVRSAAIHAALAHACVLTSRFSLNLADILLYSAKKIPSQLLSIKIRRFRLLIR